MADINLLVASDNGNSEHDLIINGELIRQPNVIARVDELPNMDSLDVNNLVENIHDNTIVTCDSPCGIYYCGNYAINSSQPVRSIEVGIDNSKLDSDIVFINVLAQCAAFATKAYYKEKGTFDKTITVDIDMSTSLPIEQHNEHDAMQFASKFTNQAHRLTVHAGKASAMLELSFNFVKVIPEGVTASHALTSDNKYLSGRTDIKKEDFKKFKILHVAIGEGTTEYPVTDGIAFNPEFIHGSPNGIGLAIDKGIEKFAKSKGLEELSRQNYSKILIDKKHKYNAEAIQRIGIHIEKQADDIYIKAKGELQKAKNDVDIIVVYGGGSILMRPYLIKKLEKISNRAGTKLLYIDAEYAVTIEAEGLWHFANSKLFGTLKKRDKETLVNA